MKIIRTLKLKHFNGELDNLNEFDAKLLKYISELTEIGNGDIIRFVKDDDSYNIFVMQLSSKHFWYDEKLLFLLDMKDREIANSNIELFLYKHLNLKDFKRGIYSNTRTDRIGLPHFTNIRPTVTRIKAM